MAAVASGAIVAIVGIALDENLHVQTADVTSGPIARRVLVSGTLEPADGGGGLAGEALVPILVETGIADARGPN